MLVALLTPAPAAAVWNNPREIVHNTAAVLEQGELLVGVVTPVAYGITDSIMLHMHPILWALLTPNAGLRISVFDSDVFRLSLTSEVGATITEGSARPPDDRPLGHVNGGVASTFNVGGGVLISAAAGYQHDFSERIDGEVADDDSFIWHLGVNWLITPKHLILTTGGAQYSTRQSGLKAPFGSIVYAYAFDGGGRLGLGVAAGTFPVAIDKDDIRTVNVWPVIDWWKRF